jgi:hypothetical protein
MVEGMAAGGEEDTDASRDSRAPGAIPCTRMIRTKQRISWFSQNDEGRPETTGAWWEGAVALGAHGEEEKRVGGGARGERRLGARVSRIQMGIKREEERAGGTAVVGEEDHCLLTHMA